MEASFPPRRDGGTPQREERQERPSRRRRRGRASTSSGRVRRPQCEVKTITFKGIFYCLTHRVSKIVKNLNYKKASLDFFKIFIKKQFLPHLKRLLNIFHMCILLLV